MSYTYQWNYPYDLSIEDRHTEKNGEHHFWVFSYDKPHTKGSNTSPRTEMSMKNHYTTGKH